MKKLLITFPLLVSAALNAQSLKEGRRLTEIENYDKAREVFRELYKKDPSAENAYYLGNAYYVLGKEDSASFYFQEGLKKDESFPLNHAGAGKTAYSKDPAKAKKEFDRALKLAKPAEPRTAEAIAAFYIEKDALEVPAAISIIDEAIKNNPGNADLLLLKGDAYWKIRDGNKAIAAYQEALKMKPAYPPALVRLGDSYQKVMNYDKSVEYFNQAVAADTGYAPAYRELGDSYFRLKNREKANESYKKYVMLGGDDPDTRLYYASNLLGSGDYKKAVEVLSPVEKQKSFDPLIHRLLGIAYYEEGNYDKSLAHLQALMQKPEVKKIAADYDYLGRDYLKTGQEAQAAEWLEKAIQMDSTRYLAISSLADVYLGNKKFDKAADLYQYKVDKKQATALDAFNLGRAYYYGQEFTKADTAFGYVIKAASDYAPAYFWKARTKAAMDHNSKKGLAKPYFEKFIEAARNDVKENKKELIDAYDYLGYYYLTQKDKAKAREAYNNIKQLDPGNKKAADGLKMIDTMK